MRRRVYESVCGLDKLEAEYDERLTTRYEQYLKGLSEEQLREDFARAFEQLRGSEYYSNENTR